MEVLVMIKWIRNRWSRMLRTTAAPTGPAPSKFSHEAREAATDRDRQYEMDLAVAKEQSRRSAL